MNNFCKTRLKFLPILIFLFLAGSLMAQTAEDTAEVLTEADTAEMEPQLPPPAPAKIDSVKDTPNDRGHSIDLWWSLSPDDDGTGNYVTGYEIWRFEKTETGEMDSVRRKSVPYAVGYFTDRGDKDNGQDPLPNGKDYWYRIRTIVSKTVYSDSEKFGPVQAEGQWYHTGKTPLAVAVLLFSTFTVAFIVIAGGSFDFKPFIIVPIISVTFIWIREIVLLLISGSFSFQTFILAVPFSAVGSLGLFIIAGGIGYPIGRYIHKQKGGKVDLYVRPLSGINAVDEAIGRATEMGKPILYVLGLGTAADIATICSFTVLGRVAKKVAEHQSSLIVPCYDPIVMTVAQEVVKNAYAEAGRPDTYDDDMVFFVTQSQFAYVAAVNGMMLRQLPASNFYLGLFYAESLLLAETGSLAGSIQIAGTDQVAQLPFFIVACDYTLIGEELYAASAYLSKEPILLGSLKAEDWGKSIFIFLAIVGVIAATFGWQNFIDWLAIRL